MDGLESTLRYLESDAAEESLRRDPYWPKWDSPWWHMTLLWELGLAKNIPGRAVKTMVSVLDSHYIKFFPLTREEIPPGADPYRNIHCHCALGTMYQVLTAAGVSVDEALPWIRPWFLKYQLPDGGLNCDEAAYTGSKKGSIVSTLPPLEAVLRCTPRDFTPEEKDFLDRGAAYLISHKLFRSTGGAVIEPAWLKICFPRFYEYDVLRGLSFLAEWARVLGREFPREAAAEGWLGRVLDGRTSWEGVKTVLPEASGGSSFSDKASSFPLLEAAGRDPGRAGPIRSEISALEPIFDSD